MNNQQQKKRESYTFKYHSVQVDVEYVQLSHVFVPVEDVANAIQAAKLNTVQFFLLNINFQLEFDC